MPPMHHSVRSVYRPRTTILVIHASAGSETQTCCQTVPVRARVASIYGPNFFHNIIEHIGHAAYREDLQLGR